MRKNEDKSIPKQPEGLDQAAQQERDEGFATREGDPEIGMPQAGVPIGVVHGLADEDDSSLIQPQLTPPESKRGG